MMKIVNRCEKNVFSGFRSYQCQKKGKVKVEGKWYCGIHDPIKKAEKYKRQEEKWAEESKAKEKVWRRRKVEQHYCQNLSTDYLETHIEEMDDGT